MPSFYQKTIKNKIQFKGVGLHSGKHVTMNILPAAPNHGIVFKRTDLKNKNFVSAVFDSVSKVVLCTNIQNEFGASVSTIEHLMGALYGEEIDNLLVEINSGELPIMDGSAKDFVKHLALLNIDDGSEILAGRLSIEIGRYDYAIQISKLASYEKRFYNKLNYPIIKTPDVVNQKKCLNLKLF